MGYRSDLLAATRQAICEAAMHLFVEKGVATTKMEEILTASGISVGSFYYLFKNKVELAAILYLETQAQLFRSLLEELSKYKDEPVRQGIEALVRAYLHWAADHPTEMYYLTSLREGEIREATDEPEKASATAFYTHLYAWLQPAIDRGEIRVLTSESCFALWFGPTAYLVRTALDTFGVSPQPGEQQLREHLLVAQDLLADAAWQTLRCPTFGGEV